MNERRLTFSARRALAIIGSFETKLFRESEYTEADSKALREQDLKVLEEVDGDRTAREIITAAGVDLETGLHSLAWLVRTGFLYSSDAVERLLDDQADRLALFAELFSNTQHGPEFWQDEVERLVGTNPELVKLAPALSWEWEGLNPKLSGSVPSLMQVRDYFLNLFIALYDRAEELFGTESVLAKRILLDVRPQR